MTTVSADEYQQLSDIEHVLLRHDMYLGPIDRIARSANCLDAATQQIQQKQIYHSKAQEQTFKEILGNAGDNVLRSRQAGFDPFQVEIVMNHDWVTVKNYGRHIAVDINSQTGKWAPEMIFGNMKAGSNFDDTIVRLFIGKNGIGAKATNIFSRAFRIRCADPDRQLLYEQLWENNMTVCHEPVITPYSGPGFTEVSYLLDFARFGVQSFDQEALEIYGAHAASLSYVCQVPVLFNGQQYQVQSLVDYASMFFPVSRTTSITYQDPHGTYDLCLIDTPDAGVSISFVNGMITENGGVHVDAAYKVIIASISKYMEKAIEGIKLTKRDVVNHVSVFISCRLNKPMFNAQVKDCLVRPEPKIELPDKLLDGIRRWKLIEIIHREILRKQTSKMTKKLGGGKRRGNWGKAEPANAAGSKDSHLCTYILTEGDSADSYRLKFISHVPHGMGREYYGSQPLRGKLPNTLHADFIQILDNEELMAICHNINIKPDVDYTDPANFKKLHYGRVLVFPDPDNDGKHVLGLVLLFFMTKFPSLVSRGFLNFLRIPTVRVVISGQEHSFYSVESFKRTLASLPPGTSVGKPDYFKGLGTSKDHHIKKDFENPRIVTFIKDDKAIERTLLAFHKTQSNLRKEWIANWVHREVLEVENFQQLPISLFIDYELIDYSIENIIRSIPEAIDGLKESQRKALFASFKKLTKKNQEMIVERIANHAAEITNYKHGAECLADTIMMMTQHFVGSNNLPYFYPAGQFGCLDPATPILTWDGTRKLAKDITTQDVLIGDDGSPRYISKIVGGVDHMYTVTQQHGEPYRVNSEHILTLHFPKHKVIYWKKASLAWSMEYFDSQEMRIKSKRVGCHNLTKDQAEQEMRAFASKIPDDNIFDINIKTYLSYPPSRQSLFRSVRLVAPTKWPKRDVPIDPYIFGMWLGDTREKHIPELYMVNDEEVRLQLLAGLIDATGCLTSGLFEIYTHEDIVDAVDDIAKSLGFKTSRTQKVLHINGDIYRIPTRLPRKRASKRTCENFIGGKIKVDYAGPGPYVGWHIDGNERFLLGDFTVTHNTRNKGGKDAPSSRYPKVALAYWLDLVFRPEDKRLEKLLEDEGEQQECENFYPTLPIHVINGVRGIGTAYSSNIPAHNPLDVAFWLQERIMMDLEPEGGHYVPLLRPWYKGFTGTITLRPGGFFTEGRLYPQGNSWVVDELPIGYWTQDFEKELMRMEEEGIIDTYKSYSTDTEAKFVIYGYKDGMPTLKKLKLISKHSYKNMTVLYRTADRGIRPQIYDNLKDLLEDFYKLRLAKYYQRKQLELQEIDTEIHELSERARYINLVAVTKELEVRDRPEQDILADMERLKLDPKWLDKVRTRDLNKDRIPVLHKKIQKRIEDKQRLEQIRPETIYYQELEEFITSHCRQEKVPRSSHQSINPPMQITLS